MQRHHLIAVALLVITAVAYAPLIHNEFILFDDGGYITHNPHVLKGLSAEGIRWAFNVGSNSNWHPLTWLSHMADVSLWDLDARGHHLTSLLLHAGSVVILFDLMRRMTGRDGPSAFVAAVFAVHPLHVESVAWAAERKDVLSTFLGFASLWFWVEWTRVGGSRRYLASLALYALSLMTKPMLVSLPILLLLLDYWPLGRVAPAPAKPQRTRAETRLRALLKEKIPFFALALASCVITVIAQRVGKALASFDEVTLSTRFATAVSANLVYFFKVIWPSRLAVFYPLSPDGEPAELVSAGILFLIAATVAAIRFARRAPWLAVGWLWWFVMLVPVSGIVQVGRQSMADRYTYVPLVGLSIVFAWGAVELAAKWKPGRMVAATLALSAASVWIALTRAQVMRWKDDRTLFEHAAAVTERNALAHFRLGFDSMQENKLAEAAVHYELAVRFDPRDANAHNDYGVALLGLRRYDEAVEQFSQAIERKFDGPDAYFNRARALIAKGRIAEASTDVRSGLELDPANADGRSLMEWTLRNSPQRPPSSSHK